MNNTNQKEHLGYDVCAILITYEPDEELLRLNLSAIADQAMKVVVVDNGSSQCHLWKGMLQIWTNVYLVELGENLGIAAAINVGIEQARKMRAEYVLLLDQDSEASKHMVRDLLALYNQLILAGYRVSAVGPRFCDRSDGSVSTPVKYTFFGTTLSKDKLECCQAIAVDFLISSGSLIAMSVFDSVGEMNESLFIDHVDTEWMLRSQNHRYRAFMHDTATMQHARGEYRMRIWMGRWRNIPMNKPFRYYYLFRNSLLIMSDQGISLRWKVMEAQRLLRVVTVVILLSGERISTLRYIVKGLLDGFMKRSGPLLEK